MTLERVADIDGRVARDTTLIKDRAAAGFKPIAFEEPRPHQKRGIRWMQEQERGENPYAPGVKGGILADDMGLGKTFQMLSLIAIDFSKSGTTKPTLVVCPKAVFNSWETDAKIFASKLQVHRWHEEGRISAKEISEKASTGPLLVITNEWNLANNNSNLMPIDWRRVVLDESQRINNGANDFKAACDLRADHKWSLSGTPVENKLEDFDQHLKLIGANQMFNAGQMEDPTKLRGVCLRRTKLGVQHHYQLSLPDSFVYVNPNDPDALPFEMDPDEKMAFEQKFGHISNMLAKSVKHAIGSSVKDYE